MLLDIYKIKNIKKKFAYLRLQIAILLIAVIAGFALMLTTCMLNFWLAKEQIGHTKISIFALLNIPYCISFLWCPLLDRFKVGGLWQILGHRAAWIFVTQIVLALFVFILSFNTPSGSIMQLAISAFMVALISATYGSLANSFRSEVLTPEEQGFASGIYIFGYRLGLLLGSSGSIYASIYISWQQIYSIASILIFIMSFLIAKLLSRCSKAKIKVHQPETILVREILEPIGSLKFILVILSFLILYRLADNFITIMLNPFLLSLKFTEADIAIGSTVYSSIGVMSGGVIGGYLMRKINIVDSLWYFGIMHVITHFSLIALSMIGKSMPLYLIVSLAEGVTNGMAMAAYLSFMTAICKGSYKTTQQAFFGSVMGVSRVVLPAFAGALAHNVGWSNFFTLITIIGILSLILLRAARKHFWQHIYSR